ncbi:MAG: hypothetical protein JW876_04210 [Candidatus Krumholzibacteriota bacterium]|nr:hypothetical protein [Candidatus Krumholzibacteriota bacterium]
MTSNSLAALAALAIACLFVPAAADASWSSDEIELCAEGGCQWYPSVVSDGLGGAIIVWQDYRAGNGDLYAQRVTSAGDPGWGAAGMAVCDDPGQQEFFRQTISDGAGGVIVVWMDHRDGGTDVYAQRIDGAGNRAWAAGGVAVSNGATDDFFPLVAADGAGGAIVAWQVGQGDESVVCASRILADGTPGWAGDVVVRGGGAPRVPVMVPDGAGGAIVAWIEDGSGAGAIVAQRIDADGAARWGGGVAVCVEGDVRSSFDACGDGLGGAVFVWHDLRGGDYDIYAQRIDAAGAILWASGGLAVCQAANDQWFPRVVLTDPGGVVALWTDLRDEGNDVYAQRIALSGSTSWIAGGRAVIAAPGHQVNPRLVADGVGGACVAWQDGRSGEYDVYAQRIDAAGEPLWETGGVAICTDPGDQRLPELGADGAGGAIVAWEGESIDADVFCTRVTADGDFVATAVAAWSASPSDGAIVVSWALAPGGDHPDFLLLRREAASEIWIDLAAAAIDFDGEAYAVHDTDIVPGRSYVYRLDAIEDGERVILFETGAVSVPAAPFALRQNTPNPFNPVTTIRYSLAASGFVRLAVYDAAGRRIAVLVDGVERAGDHAVEWCGRDDRGGRAGSGVYFAVLSSGKSRLSMKMVLLR